MSSDSTYIPQGIHTFTPENAELPSLQSVIEWQLNATKWYEEKLGAEQAKEKEWLISYSTWIFLNEDQIATLDKEWQGSDNAHELRGDFRRKEGNDRELQNDDTRSTMVHNISDGLNEALAIGISNQWLQEEKEWEDNMTVKKWREFNQTQSQWEYWVNNHHVLQMCRTCRIASSPAGCASCDTNVLKIVKAWFADKPLAKPNTPETYFREIMDTMYV
jgi:hypothetical protein